MIAKTFGTCPACKTPIIPADGFRPYFSRGIETMPGFPGHDITKRPVGKGGREVWAHTDCEVVAWLTEIDNDIAQADEYAAHKAIIDAAAAKKAAHEQALTAAYFASPRKALADINGRLAEAERIYALPMYADSTYDREYAERIRNAEEARSDYRFLLALAGEHEDIIESNLAAIHEAARESQREAERAWAERVRR